MLILEQKCSMLGVIASAAYNNYWRNLERADFLPHVGVQRSCKALWAALIIGKMY